MTITKQISPWKISPTFNPKRVSLNGSNQMTINATIPMRLSPCDSPHVTIPMRQSQCYYPNAIIPM